MRFLGYLCYSQHLKYLESEVLRFQNIQNTPQNEVLGFQNPVIDSPRIHGLWFSGCLGLCLHLGWRRRSPPPRL